MSKNLTRKGLALGATVALGSTLFAGAPAFAAGEVVFAPSTGTSYNTFITESLTLAASLAPGQVAGNIVQLKYAVTVPTGVTLQHKVNGAVSYTDLAATGVIAGSGSTTVANTLELGVKYTAGTTAPVATAASISIPVIAWLDSDSDNVVDAGEFQQARTLGFKKYSEVVPTVALTSPLAADASLKATVDLGDINVEQLGVTATAKGNVEVDFGITGTGTLAGSTTKASGAYSEVATSLTAADVVTARAQFKTVNLGTAAVSATVAARTISQPTAAVVAGNNGVVAGNIARTNSAFAVAATVKDTATTPVVKAGVAVKAAITTTATLSTTKTLSINGTVYNGTTAIPSTIDLVTDANGLATVNFVTVGFLATEAITVTYTAQNYSAAVTVDLQDAAYTVVSTAVGSAERSIAEGGSATFNYAVKDQFGVAISATSRLKVVVGYTTPVTSYVNLVNGAGSVTVTDTTENTDADITVAAGLQTQDATTLNWSPDAPTVSADVQTVNVTATALAFDTVPVNQNIALSTSVALTTASVNNPGAAVTVSSPGVTFTVGGKDYVDTVTLFSAATTGDIVVSAKSNIAGAHTITYTAGSVVKTSVVTVAAAAETAGASIDLSSVPATIVPGSTLVYTGYLKDVYGNGVDTDQGVAGTPTFSVTYSGPGFIVGGSTPTATDENGKFTFTVILGVNDSGSASVTVKYDADGATTTIAEISKTATTSIAKAAPAPATAAASGSTGKVYVSVTNAAGKTVVVKINGKFAKSFVGTSAKKVVAVVASKGAKNVSVYVSGKALVSKVITVK